MSHMKNMRVTFNGDDTNVTYEPLVPGPKPVLYDHLERPLRRPIGFTLDNRLEPVVRSRTKENAQKDHRKY